MTHKSARLLLQWASMLQQDMLPPVCSLTGTVCIGRASESALTGYSVYAAYNGPGERSMPRRFALYAMLPSQVDTASPVPAGTASLDASGKALASIPVSSLLPSRFLSSTSLAQGISLAGVGGGRGDGEAAWPGTAWLRVVPRSGAGESQSKGSWCGASCQVRGPLPVMALPQPQPPTNLVAAALGHGRVSLAWTGAAQPALLEHEVRFRISVAPLLGRPAEQGKGSERLRAAADFVELSQVAGSSAVISGLNASDWLVLIPTSFLATSCLSNPSILHS